MEEQGHRQGERHGSAHDLQDGTALIEVSRVGGASNAPSMRRAQCDGR
jgi:hypothetical protein